MKLMTMMAAMIASAALAEATTVVPADLADLTRAARVIARGRIVSVNPRWIDDRRAVETLVTLAPDAYLKGSFGPLVQFRVPGGQIGRYRRVVVGAPRFVAGQTVIVFLGSRSPALPYIIGLNQGLFRVTRAREGAAQVIPPPTVHEWTAGTRNGSRIHVAPTNRIRRPIALVEFEQQVRRLIGEHR
jgi:hypothetical protein